MLVLQDLIVHFLANKPNLIGLGSLLVGDGLLLAHGGNNGDKKILALVKVSLDLIAELTLRDLDIVLLVGVSVEQVKETIIDVDEGVLNTLDVGDLKGKKNLISLLNLHMYVVLMHVIS